MPKHKLSPEDRTAEKRKENLHNIMKGLDIKNFDALMMFSNSWSDQNC